MYIIAAVYRRRGLVTWAGSPGVADSHHRLLLLYSAPTQIAVCRESLVGPERIR